MIASSKLESILEEDGIIFLTYGGLFTQSLIAGMTEALEREAEVHDLTMKLSNNIFVVFIELAQNILNYSKKAQDTVLFDPKGLIYVGRKNDHYHVCSQNMISEEDKEKLVSKLEMIKHASKEEIRQRYREVRKSGAESHDKGSGLGFLEIAKKAEKIDYLFTPLSDGKVLFKFCAIL
jgi:hypothetical protein